MACIALFAFVALPLIHGQALSLTTTRVLVTPPTTTRTLIAVQSSSPSRQLIADPTYPQRKLIKPIMDDPADPAVIAIWPNRGSLYVGQTLILSASWTGAASYYTVDFFSGPSSTCQDDTTFVSSAYGQSGVSVSTMPPGSLYYCASIEEANGTRVYSTTVFVSVYPQLSGASISMAPNPVNLGQTSTATVSWSGGDSESGYFVSLYSVSTQMQQCDTGTLVSSGGTAQNTWSAAVTPDATSKGYYCAVIRDTAGMTLSTSSTLLTITGQPLNATLSGISPIDSGEWTAIFLNITGGVPPYSSITYVSTNSLCTSFTELPAVTQGAMNLYGPVYNTTCFYSVVKDTATNSVTTNTLKIWTYPGLVFYTFPEINPSNTVTQGTPVTLTEKVSGGSGSFRYQWYSGPFPDGMCGGGTAIPGATSLTYKTASMPVGVNQYCFSIEDIYVHHIQMRTAVVYVTVLPPPSHVLNVETIGAAPQQTGSVIEVYQINGKAVQFPLGGGVAAHVVQTDWLPSSTENSASVIQRTTVQSTPSVIYPTTYPTATTGQSGADQATVETPVSGPTLPSFGRTSNKLPPQLLRLSAG